MPAGDGTEGGHRSEYVVVVLLTDELTEHDVARLVELYRRAAEPVTYHLLVSTNPHDVLESALAAIGVKPGDLYGTAAVRDRVAEEEQREADQWARLAAELSASRLRALGQTADATIKHGDPVQTCRRLATELRADEVVVMTRRRRTTEFPELDLVGGRHFGVRGVRYLPGGSV